MGRLIVFEGIDGCGKSTQIQLLENALAQEGKLALKLREPGGTPVGEKIREVLADVRNDNLSPLAECLLFMASRAQLTDTVVKPALDMGRIVILDRYYYSTAAYQGAAEKLGMDFILNLSENIFKFPLPDLVVILDIDPKVAAKRMNRPPDRIEMKGIAHQEKVRDAFLKIAKKDPIRFNVINATDSIEHVHDKVYAAVKSAL